MDKFDRRPTPKQRRQQLVIFVVAFTIPTVWFGSMFIFGNRAAGWSIAIYVVGLVGLVALEARSLRSNARLWISGLKFQPDQGPGFSPLEAAAVEELIAAVASGAEVRKSLASAEVAVRYNSGQGCVTTIAGARGGLPSKVLDHVIWFRLHGLDAPVGCRFWATPEGGLDMIEFFTSAGTAVVDWPRASFEVVDAPTDVSTPTARPLVTEPSWKRFRYEG